MVKKFWAERRKSLDVRRSITPRNQDADASLLKTLDHRTGVTNAR